MPAWRKLNAYVDAELDQRDAAEVACAAGRDPGVAEQISLLYHVKCGVHEAFSSAPPADLASLMPPPKPRIALKAVAAAAAVVIAAGLFAFSVLRTDAPTGAGQAEFMASARALHGQWLQHELSDRVDTPPVVLAALTQFGRLPLVPDLESTGLSVALVSVADLSAGRVLQIGYRGHHGCHLSLFVVAGTSLSDAAIGDREALERSHAWQVDDMGYLLLARGMDTGRFTQIAEKVEHATRVGAPLDEEARQQLAENRLHSTSCKV